MTKPVLDLNEEYEKYLKKMKDVDLSSSTLDFENGVKFPFPSDNCADASTMLKAENCDMEAAKKCVRVARGEKKRGKKNV